MRTTIGIFSIVLFIFSTSPGAADYITPLLDGIVQEGEYDNSYEITMTDIADCGCGGVPITEDGIISIGRDENAVWISLKHPYNASDVNGKLTFAITLETRKRDNVQIVDRKSGIFSTSGEEIILLDQYMEIDRLYNKEGVNYNDTTDFTMAMSIDSGYSHFEMRIPFLQSEDEPQDRVFADEDQVAVSFKIKREYDDELSHKLWGFHALSETYFLTISSDDALLQSDSTQTGETSLQAVYFMIFPIIVVLRGFVKPNTKR